MANSDRRQTLANHYIGRANRPDNVKTTRRQTTSGHNQGSTHDQDRDNDNDSEAEAFNTIIRHTHNRAHDQTYTRTPVPRYRQSTTQQQRTSTREEYHDNPIQDHLFAYKSQLVDDLNAQMNRADDEITQSMDDLSEEFDGQLKIIEDAGGRFWAGLGEERVVIGAVNGDGDGGGQKGVKEIALQQVMADLEKLMDLKRARLKLLMVEYTRVRAESVKLAIAILGKEKVSLFEPESEPIEDNNQRTKTAPGRPPRQTQGLVIDVETDTSTTTPTSSLDNLDQICSDAESGLIDLQNTLDELVSRTLEENKGALKAFQNGRKVNQGELSKLLSSWSFV